MGMGTGTGLSMRVWALSMSMSIGYDLRRVNREERKANESTRLDSTRLFYVLTHFVRNPYTHICIHVLYKVAW